MNIKQATITLTHSKQWREGGHGRLLDSPVDRFTVERVTDSIAYLPGQTLSKDEVEGLCRNGGWKVVIQKPKG